MILKRTSTKCEVRQEEVDVPVSASCQKSSQGIIQKVSPFTIIGQQKMGDLEKNSGNFYGLVEQHGCNIQPTEAELLLQIPSLQMVQCSILLLSLESLHLLFHERSSCHCV